MVNGITLKNTDYQKKQRSIRTNFRKSDSPSTVEQTH